MKSRPLIGLLGLDDGTSALKTKLETQLRRLADLTTLDPARSEHRTLDLIVVVAVDEVDSSTCSVAMTLFNSTPVVVVGVNDTSQRALWIRAGARHVLSGDEPAEILEAIVERESRSLAALQSSNAYFADLADPGMMVGILFHEIKNPLAVLEANQFMLRELIRSAQDGENDAWDQIYEILHANDTGCERMRQVFDWMSSAFGGTQGQRVNYRLNDEIRSTARILDALLRSRVKLNLNLEDSLPTLSLPHRALNQVFLNLLLNAVEAFDEQGEIEVETWSDGQTVFAEVRDNGRGMSPQEIEALWRVGTSTKAGPGPRGMGLAISRRIVRSCNGILAVESTLGQGSRFRIALPINA